MFSGGRNSKNKDPYFLCLIISFLLGTLAFGDPNNTQNSSVFNRESFPPSFLFGSASSSFQYEGAAAEDGRKPSIWDTFIQKFPELIVDHSNASVAVDQYHRYKEDVALMKDIGFNVYRLSISWSRVLPNGNLSGGVNQAGIDYYNNLINELLSNGIQPVVTLFHWDLPQALEDQYQGFLSPKIIDDFRDYAGLCFSKFGDRVKLWLTLNEPLTFIQTGYQSGAFPPNRCSDRSLCSAGDSSTEPYIVGHNQLLAHAAAVNLYRQTYQNDQKGQIGIALNGAWMVPFSNSTEDKLAADRALAFQFGWFLEPIHYGSYPKEMISSMGNRLPIFSPNESNLVKGSCDFIGLNYYTSRYAAHRPCQTNNDACVVITGERNGIPIGPKVGTWIYVYPEGIQQLLLYTKDKYNDPIMYITENGVGDPDGTADSIFLDDKLRIDYYNNHLAHVHKAIWLGAKVRGFMAWSLLDNFEWRRGFTARGGIVHIDYNNGLKRIPKQSYYWFKNFMSSSNNETTSSTKN